MRTSWMVRGSGCVAAILVMLVSVEKPAYGYTDPGSGALLWQMLMASIVGGAFYFRRLLSWFRRDKPAVHQTHTREQ